MLARSLAGGRKEGILSSLGTFAGGLIHVIAAALGLSAILAASALAFSVVKYAGAAYLIYLGIRTLQTRNLHLDGASEAVQSSFQQGIWTEVLNPKTWFFQFALLGGISVLFNTSADLVVASCAGLISEKLRANPALQRRQRMASGVGMIGLGVFVGCSGTSHTK